MQPPARSGAPPWDTSTGAPGVTTPMVSMTMPEGGIGNADPDGAPAPALPPPGFMPAPGPGAPSPPPPSAAQMVPYNGQPPQGYDPGMPSEAMGEMQHEASHMLGLATLAVGVGGLLGYRYGGVYGSIAGGLFGGAVVNGYRALSYYQEGTEDGDKEAGVSATYAVLSGAVASYLLAKHVELRTGDEDEEGEETLAALPNPEVASEELPLVAPMGPCASRSVGPRVVPTAEVIEAAEVED